jgi:hypothetical protein
MESVLLGMAAPAAVGTAGSLLDRTLHAAAEPFAVLLHAIGSAALPEGNESAAAASDTLHGKLDVLRNELAGAIENALTSAGVDLSEPIALRISEADGHLEVAGDHPQKAIIEAALADDPDLANKFAEVAALTQLLAAVNKLDETNSTDAVALGQAEQYSVTALFSANDDGAILEFLESVAG